MGRDGSADVPGTALRPGPNRVTTVTDRRRSPWLTLSRRVLLVAACYMALVGTGQALALVSRARLDRTLEQVQRRIIPAQAAAARLESSLLNQRAAVLGFVLTGKERFLEPYEQGRREEIAARKVLREGLADLPEFASEARSLNEAIDAWKAGVLGPALDAIRDGRGGEAGLMIAERGTLLFDPVLRRSQGLTGALADRLDRDQDRIVAAEDQLGRLMLAGGLIGFVLSATSVWFLRRWVTQPITALSQRVRRVASGDLGQVIRSSGPPELIALGADVEAMRRRILAELDTAVKAVEALEQGEPLVVALRSELMGRAESLAPGWSVTSRFLPAEGVLAGDWFDLVELDGELVVLAMVDISGHGSTAGLLAFKIKQLLVPALRLGMDPGQALGWVSSQMGDTGDYFATCLVVELDLSTGSCRYANAGHPAGILARVGGQEELGPTGPLLGPLEATWLTRSTRILPGDSLVVYTDGLVEARSETGEEFGVDRLTALIASNHDRSTDEMADELMAAVRAFGRSRLPDDATLLVVGRHGQRSGGTSHLVAAGNRTGRRRGPR